MFRIKICGITNRADAVAAFELGARAIGLNFYEKSPRRVDVATARSITDSLYDVGRHGPGLVYPIGVFVNQSAAHVRQIFHDVHLVAAQLHGDEPPNFLAEIAGIPAIRVRRLGASGVAEIAADFSECRAVIDAVDPKIRSSVDLLVDAAAPGQYGGSGKTVAWDRLTDHRNWLGNARFILAGGLTPENVAEAIRLVRPQAVDVASGVESSPGKKDHAKMRDFVAAAQEAFASI